MDTEIRGELGLTDTRFYSDQTALAVTLTDHNQTKLIKTVLARKVGI